MAARRLLIVLAILMAISIAAAAIAPQRPVTGPGEPATTATEEATDRSTGSGGRVRERLQASADSPPTARAEVGDQLSLSVGAEMPLEVEIANLGLIGNADPAAPALFDVLLRDPGALAVTDAANGQIVGRVLVRRPRAGMDP